MSLFTCENQIFLVLSRNAIFQDHNSRFKCQSVFLRSGVPVFCDTNRFVTIESLHFTALLKWLAEPYFKASKSRLNLIIQNYQSPAKIRSERGEESGLGQPGRK